MREEKREDQQIEGEKEKLSKRAIMNIINLLPSLFLEQDILNVAPNGVWLQKDTPPKLR